MARVKCPRTVAACEFSFCAHFHLPRGLLDFPAHQKLFFRLPDVFYSGTEGPFWGHYLLLLAAASQLSSAQLAHYEPRGSGSRRGRSMESNFSFPPSFRHHRERHPGQAHSEAHSRISNPSELWARPGFCHSFASPAGKNQVGQQHGASSPPWGAFSRCVNVIHLASGCYLASGGRGGCDGYDEAAQEKRN